MPVFKGHNGNAEGLYRHDKAVEHYAEAGNECAEVEECGDFAQSGQSHAGDADNQGDMFGIEPEGAVYEAGEHLVKGKSASRQDAVYPGIGIKEFAYCVYDKHGTADFAHELLDFPGHQFFAGDFFHEGYHEHGEHGACADGGKQIEEEGPRPDKEAVAENVGAAEENAVHTAEAALVESGKESAYAGEKRHINVEVMGYVLDKFIFFKCALFEDKRHIFDNKHYAVAGNAENNFREHGVHVGVPVAEPASERLADVQYENEHGACVA